MAYTNVEQPKNQGGFFSNTANPVIRKLREKAETQSPDYATYSGIIGKTVFFLLMTVVGVLLMFILHNIFASGNPGELISLNAENGVFQATIHPVEMVIMVIAGLVALIVPFVAWALIRTVPVTGSIYSLAQGLVIGFLTVALAPQYKNLSVVAFVITLGLVAGMLFVYSKGIIKVTQRFRGVLTAIFFAIIIGGALFALVCLIAPVRNFIFGSAIGRVITSPALTIAVSIIYLIVAALFMLTDFDTIKQCVDNKVDKKYEWMAAWGLAYTIIYIYLKILRILIMIFGNSKNNSSKSGNRF